MTGDRPSIDSSVAPMPFDWREALGALRRRAPLAGVTLTVVWAAVLAFTFTQTPTYEAQVALTTPENHMPSLPIDASIGAALGLRGQSLDSQKWMLTNPILLNGVAEQLGLNMSGSDLAGRVRVDIIGSSLMVMKVRDDEAGRAADIANRIAESHVEDTRQRAHDSLLSTVDALSEQLNTLDDRLAQNEGSLRDFQASHNIIDIQSQASQTANLIGTISAQITSAQAGRASASDQADYYRRVLSSEDRTYIASSTVARNPLVSSLESQLSTLEADRAAQAATRGPEHPEMVALDDRIIALRLELAAAVQTVVNQEVESENPAYREAGQQLAAAEALALAESARVSAFEAELSEQLAELQSLPDLSVQLSHLQRDATASAAVYVDLLQRYEKARAQSEVALTSIEVHSSAEPPAFPVKPRKVLNAAIGLLLGIGLGLLLVMAAEVIADPLRSERHARAELDLPILGTIPGAPRSLGRVIDEISTPGSSADDAYQALRLSVQAASAGSIVIAGGSRSGREREVALGLATAGAQAGLKTLLLEGDLRAPSFGAALGLKSDMGLADCLGGAQDPADCAQPTTIANLSVLAAGARASGTVSLLESPAARDALKTACGGFDLVVATAPAWPTPDVLPLASVLGAALVVVREGRSSRTVVKELCERLSRTGCPPIGLCILRK